MRSSDFKSIRYGVQFISRIKYGIITVWEYASDVISCFANGFWMNDKRWTNDKGWKN